MVEMEPSLWPRADNRGSWQPTNPRSAEWFSGVGYFFGKDLNARLNVPIGLIHCNWGGTRIEPWLSPEAMAKFPQYAGTLAQMDMLRDPSRRDDVTGKAVDRWWDSFDSKGPNVGPDWKSPKLDDSAWKPIQVPASWGPDGLDQFDGVVYHRVTVNVPMDQAGKAATLSLGPIDDRDDAWVNGTLVGATHEDGKWNVPRSYAIPAGVLVAGKNTVAVRVLDTASLGGIGGAGSKPEMLSVAIAGGPSIPIAGTWKYLRGPSMSEIGGAPNVDLSPWGSPTYLYNGMIATLLPHTLRGAVWYQGESNRDLGPGYRPLLAYEPRIPAILIAAKGADSTLNPLISGKTVAFSNPASLVAFEGQGWLSQRGLEAGRNYQTLAVRRDDSVGSAILRGEAAAGILSMGEFRAHPEAVRDQLTVVATMTEVPSFIVATRKDLASAQVDAIRTALLAFSQGSEEGRQFFQRSGFRAISPIADKDLAGLDAFVDRTRKALE